MVQYPRTPQESHPPTPNPTPQSPPTAIASTTQVELQEADLLALFRVGKAGVRTGPERKKAQEFADKLDAVRLPENYYIMSSDRGHRLLTTKATRRKGNRI